MLERKGVDYELASVLPGTQRVHLRLVGFRGGTVPALRLDGHRVQGSRNIARALERRQPSPSLFPADANARVLADAAERWGDEVLQMVPRRIMRWGLVQHVELRRWISEESGVPGAGVSARLGVPAAVYYARAVGADEAGGAARARGASGDARPRRRAALRRRPRPRGADRRHAPGPVQRARARGLRRPPRAGRAAACAAAARELFPDYPAVPAFLPREWLS